MSEAVIMMILGAMITGGGFVGRWIFKRLDDLQAEIKALQAKNTELIEDRANEKATLHSEIAGLKATISTLEDARKERDELRGQLAHRERLLDRLAPTWRVEYYDTEPVTGVPTKL